MTQLSGYWTEALWKQSFVCYYTLHADFELNIDLDKCMVMKVTLKNVRYGKEM
jgi:hypothetical protein